MKRAYLSIRVSVLLSVLALASILLAPVAVLSYHAQPEPAVSAGVADCDNGCHGDEHEQGSQADDCCDTAACSCACHAPLSIATVVVPLPLVLNSSFVVFHPQNPPQVYLPIFVPPQNLS